MKSTLIQPRSNSTASAALQLVPVLSDAVACRPVTPRLWRGFLVWLLYIVPVALSKMVWRVLWCLSKRGIGVLVPFLCCAGVCVSWLHIQGVWIGRAILSARLSRAMHYWIIGLLADLVWWVFVGFCLGHGFWVREIRINLACYISAAVVHWYFKARSRLESLLSGSSRKGVQCLVVPLLHDPLRLLALAGRHPAYLVGLLYNHLSSSVLPINNLLIFNTMAAAWQHVKSAV